MDHVPQRRFQNGQNAKSSSQTYSYNTALTLKASDDNASVTVIHKYLLTIWWITVMCMLLVRTSNETTTTKYLRAYIVKNHGIAYNCNISTKFIQFI